MDNNTQEEIELESEICDLHDDKIYKFTTKDAWLVAEIGPKNHSNERIMDTIKHRIYETPNGRYVCVTFYKELPPSFVFLSCTALYRALKENNLDYSFLVEEA